MLLYMIVAGVQVAGAGDAAGAAGCCLFPLERVPPLHPVLLLPALR